MAEGFKKILRLKCEKLTDDGCQVMAKAHILAWWAKNLEQVGLIPSYLELSKFGPHLKICSQWIDFFFHVISPISHCLCVNMFNVNVT